MSSSKKIILLAFLGFTLALLEYYGVLYDLSWILSWYDMMLHALGGVFIALLLSFFISQEVLSKGLFSRSFIFSLALTFVVALLWEWYELRTGVTFVSRGGYTVDTLSDIFFALLGSVATYRLLQKNSL